MFGSSGFSVVTFASAPGFIYTASVRSDVSALDLSATSFSVNSQVLETVSPQVELVTAGSTFISSTLEQASASDIAASSFSINSSVSDSVEVSQFRDVGGGYSTDAFSSGPFSSLGSISYKISGDVIYANVSVNVAVNDQVSGLDQVSRRIIISTSTTDTSEISDSLLASQVFASSVADTAEAADEIEMSDIVFPVRTVENASTSETIEARADFLSFTASSVFCYERYLADATFAVKVEESPQASDNNRANRTTIAVIQESVEAGDAFIARYLWEPINTFEQQTWNTIKTAEVELVVTVGGGFSAGAFSSGPISGLGGVASVVPITEIWTTEDTAQADTWNLVRTVD